MRSTFDRSEDVMRHGTICHQCQGSGKAKNPAYSHWEIYVGAYLPWIIASDPARNGTWEEQADWDMRAGAPPRRIDCSRCHGEGYVLPTRRRRDNYQAALYAGG